MMSCGFWPLVHTWEYRWSSQSFPSERTAGVSSRSFTVTNKSISLTFTVASSIVCTSPLVVATVVGLLETITVSNSAEFRSFLFNMCIDDPESTTKSLSIAFIADGAGRHHSLVGEKKVALTCTVSLEMFLANLHVCPRAQRSCLAVSSWDLSSNFKAYGLRWWGTLTWIFPSYGPLFSRMLAWRCAAFVNRTRRIIPKIFVQIRKMGKDPGGCVSWNAQPICHAPFNIATAPLSPSFFGYFAGMTFLCPNEHLSPNLHPDSDLQNWHSGECQESHGDLVQIPFR